MTRAQKAAAAEKSMNGGEDNDATFLTDVMFKNAPKPPTNTKPKFNRPSSS